jgi:hypothetical protein
MAKPRSVRCCLPIPMPSAALPMRYAATGRSRLRTMLRPSGLFGHGRPRFCRVVGDL